MTNQKHRYKINDVRFNVPNNPIQFVFTYVRRYTFDLETNKSLIVKNRVYGVTN